MADVPKVSGGAGPVRLEKSEIDALTCLPDQRETLVFDDTLKGFGIRVSANGLKTYLFQYRRGGQVRRLVLGRHGGITPAQARTPPHSRQRQRQGQKRGKKPSRTPSRSKSWWNCGRKRASPPPAKATGAKGQRRFGGASTSFWTSQPTASHQPSCNGQWTK